MLLSLTMAGRTRVQRSSAPDLGGIVTSVRQPQNEKNRFDTVHWPYTWIIFTFAFDSRLSGDLAFFSLFCPLVPL